MADVLELRGHTYHSDYVDEIEKEKRAHVRPLLVMGAKPKLRELEPGEQKGPVLSDLSYRTW